MEERMITKDEIIKRLEANSYAAEYAAYNYNGSKREHLIPGAIESTCPGMQLLIEIRNNEQMIKELKESSVVIANVMFSRFDEEIEKLRTNTGYTNEEKIAISDWYRITREAISHQKISGA